MEEKDLRQLKLKIASLHYSRSRDISIMLVLFIISPTFGMLLFSLYLIQTNQKNLCNLFVWLITIYCLCIFTTRIYTNIGFGTDIDNTYQLNFRAVEGKNLLQYLLTQKEYGFAFVHWIGYHLFMGNYFLHVSFIQSCTYTFAIFSIYKFWKHQKYPASLLVAMLSLIIFMAPFWVATNNLMRQQFATSIMTYVIINKLISGKTNWWLMALAVTSHSMAALFVPFVFFKVLQQKLSYKQLFLIIIVMGTAVYTFGHLSIFQEVELYGAQRLAAAADYRKTDIIDSNIVYVFLVPVVLVYIKNMVIENWCTKELRFVHNYMLILIILVALMVSMPLMQTRYYIARFFLIPYVFANVLIPDTFYAKIYHLAIFITFFIWFHLYTDGSYNIPQNVVGAKTIIEFIINILEKL